MVLSDNLSLHTKTNVHVATHAMGNRGWVIVEHISEEYDFLRLVLESITSRSHRTIKARWP